MLSVRISAEQEAMLDRLARETGRSKSYYVKRALDDFLANRADHLLAIATLEREEPRYSPAEVRRELGL
jgi:RHH-type rel operon transcriptional repressor/antitoxin RelB